MSTYSPNPPSDQTTIDANRYGQFTPWQRQQLKPPSLVGSLVLLGLVGTVQRAAGYLLDRAAARILCGQRYSALLQPDLPGRVQPVSGGVVPLLVVPLVGLRGKLRLRRDLAESLIAQEDGQVIFTRSVGYNASAAGQPLRSMDGGKEVSLAPGSYRFYYLPHTRRILSAERQPFFEPGGPKAGLRMALAAAHGFQMDELDTNRQGRVAGGQRSLLVSKLLFLVVVLGVGLGWVIWQFALVLQYAPWSFLGLGFFLLIMGMLTRERWLDLLEGRALMLEGLVQAIEESSDDSSSYYYVLDRQRFSVSAIAHKALVPGERYRLYYLPHSKKLLSIEPLP